MPALVRDSSPAPSDSSGSPGSKIRLIDHVRPERAPGEARVRLRLAGVCSTDLELAKGYMDYDGVLGHEFVGEVEEATDPAWVGERVVGGINCACQSCSFCSREQPNHCERRTVLGILGRHGTFQDSFLLPERNLVRVPAHVPDEHAVFAEPLAAACRILEQVDLSAWDRVAVLGDGKLGLLCTMVLAEVIHSVTLFGRHPGRVKLPISVEERPAPPPEFDPSARFDVVVDATGSSEGLATAMRLTRPSGRLVLKTTCAGNSTVALAPIVIDELTVIGSRCGPLETAMSKLGEGRLPLHEMIDSRVSLEEADAALRRAAEPGVLKVLIEGASG